MNPEGASVVVELHDKEGKVVWWGSCGLPFPLTAGTLPVLTLEQAISSAAQTAVYIGRHKLPEVENEG